jgi:hypothetical protein
MMTATKGVKIMMTYYYKLTLDGHLAADLTTHAEVKEGDIVTATWRDENGNGHKKEGKVTNIDDVEFYEHD